MKDEERKSLIGQFPSFMPWDIGRLHTAAFAEIFKSQEGRSAILGRRPEIGIAWLSAEPKDIRFTFEAPLGNRKRADLLIECCPLGLELLIETKAADGVDLAQFKNYRLKHSAAKLFLLAPGITGHLYSAIPRGKDDPNLIGIEEIAETCREVGYGDANGILGLYSIFARQEWSRFKAAKAFIQGEGEGRFVELNSSLLDHRAGSKANDLLASAWFGKASAALLQAGSDPSCFVRNAVQDRGICFYDFSGYELGPDIFIDVVVPNNSNCGQIIVKCGSKRPQLGTMEQVINRSREMHRMQDSPRWGAGQKRLKSTVTLWKYSEEITPEAVEQLPQVAAEAISFVEDFYALEWPVSV